MDERAKETPLWLYGVGAFGLMIAAGVIGLFNGDWRNTLAPFLDLPSPVAIAFIIGRFFAIPLIVVGAVAVSRWAKRRRLSNGGGTRDGL